MINYNNEYNEMTMTCDNPRCQDSEIFNGTFQECITTAKEANWKIVPLNSGEFSHICPLCIARETDPIEVFKP